MMLHFILKSDSWLHVKVTNIFCFSKWTVNDYIFSSAVIFFTHQWSFMSDTQEGLRRMDR